MNSIQTIIDGVEVAVPLQLITKYDQPLPRYTSYPTAPVWSEALNHTDYTAALRRCRERNQETQRGISAYIHLPFCAERCTFCACNVVISKRRDVIDPYLTALEREITLTAEQLSGVSIQQLHLGGGTPTYLEPDEMRRLITSLQRALPFSSDAEISIEADPRWTNDEKLVGLRTLGFNRISFGVQDVTEKVQRAINRVQPLPLVAEQIRGARKAGFSSINIDLVYGLPHQTRESWEETLQSVKSLNPDRIALFSFAYVPWLHRHHQRIEQETLPPPVEKFRLFAAAIQFFGSLGYDFIGLDHFAKKEDELSRARIDRTLHRNFQGYTTRAGLDLIGLGVTSIGDVAGSYVQNDRKLASYQARMAKGEFATVRGMIRSQDDDARRWVIGRIFCHNLVVKKEFEERWHTSFDAYFSDIGDPLDAMADDGLLDNSTEALMITSLGRLFLRNIGSAFDHYLTSGVGTFSRAV